MKKLAKYLAKSLLKSTFEWKYELVMKAGREGIQNGEIGDLNFSFSQFGEDLRVKRLARKIGITKGVYIDVGAYDPVEFSNTLLLYKKGWRGVNIDVNSEKIKKFDEQRKRDTNICAAIGEGGKKYVVENKGMPAEKIRPVREQKGVNEGEIIESKRLDKIIKKTFLKNEKINYINIDCEGKDLEVIKQINMDVRRPDIISIEALDRDKANEIDSYMQKEGYVMNEKMKWTLIYVSKKSSINSGWLKVD